MIIIVARGTSYNLTTFLANVAVAVALAAERQRGSGDEYTRLERDNYQEVLEEIGRMGREAPRGAAGASANAVLDVWRRAQLAAARHPLVHHRRFASGYRACELSGPPTPTTDLESSRADRATCAACVEDLHRRHLLK